MAFGFVILAFLLLLAAAFFGLGIWAVPVGLLALGAAVFLFVNRAKRVAEGGGKGTSPGHSSGAGGTHQREDYAHTGQAYMTPEQMKRSRAGA
jgi:hypothetical protein